MFFCRVSGEITFISTPQPPLHSLHPTTLHSTTPHSTTPPPHNPPPHNTPLHNYWYLLTQILCIIFKYSLGRLFCGAINAYATRVSAYFLFLNFYFLMYGPEISIQIKFWLFTFPLDTWWYLQTESEGG